MDNTGTWTIYITVLMPINNIPQKTIRDRDNRSNYNMDPLILMILLTKGSCQKHKCMVVLWWVRVFGGLTIIVSYLVFYKI